MVAGQVWYHQCGNYNGSGGRSHVDRQTEKLVGTSPLVIEAATLGVHASEIAEFVPRREAG